MTLNMWKETIQPLKKGLKEAFRFYGTIFLAFLIILVALFAAHLVWRMFK